MTNTCLCYIERDNKYLMLHRVKKEKDLNRDKWVGIGGKFEEGETPEECNLREAFEETGLTLKNQTYRGIVTFVSDKWGTEYMHLFHSDCFEGNLKECDEGNLEWVEKSEVYNLPLWAGDKIFLGLLEEDIPFFSLKLVYEGEKLIGAILNEKNLDLGEV
ncbi:MAG: 8-oxo-dGTP diphosphatase [Clostridia bacterium]|nr:8-oxo-dGTP diphosphatase [Clostridia bacterium]